MDKANGSQMIISVALCTYNGARFIQEQIESILNQTIKVDEIVVCDDGSKDDTISIIEKFQGTATDIRVYRNETNIGVCANFQKAINLCHGDIIFLSDQDDVWHSDKVKVIMNFFQENEDKQVVFSDGLLINSNGNTISNKTLWGTIGFTKRAQIDMIDGLGPEIFSYENRATGATMAIRRTFIEENPFLNVCNGTILHDGALALLGIAKNKLGYISQPLINYRIHTEQKVGFGDAIHSPLSDDARVTSPLCEQWYSIPLSSPLKEHIAFIRARHRYKRQLLGSFRMIHSIGTYCKYYHCKWLSFFFFDIRQWFIITWRRIIK